MLRFSAYFRSQCSRYSSLSPINESSADRKPRLMVDYLIHSLQFSKQDAVAVSSKGNLTNLRSPVNSDLVVNLFQNYGLDLPQIRQIISFSPKILTCKADKTLEPKLKVFQELGLSGSDLVRLIQKNPSLFDLGLHSKIIPIIDYLRVLLGTDEKVVETIIISRWLFSTSLALKMFSDNVNLLRGYGFSNEQIGKFVTKNARHFTQTPDWLTGKLNWIEGKVGVSRDSNEFFRCFHAIASSSIVGMEKKMEVYKSFGFSDTELSSLFKNQPYCFALSEDTIRKKLSFFMNELGYAPSYLVTCPSLFSLSLEKRVKPRNKVLDILKGRMMVESKSLITLVNYSEVRFQDFLRGFEDKIPSLYETYISSIR